MPPKRPRALSNSTSKKTVDIPDLWTSHMFLAPNEISSVAIGIYSCLIRPCEYEHFANPFYPGNIIGLKTNNFIYRLNELEKKLKKDCQLDTERCVMIARLRKYLTDNAESFQKILGQIETHLHHSMQEILPWPSPQSFDDLTSQCIERNRLALEQRRAHHVGRLLLQDYKDADQPMNLIKLQTLTQNHFQILINNIKPNVPNHLQLRSQLKDLLNNAFIIIRNPSPAVVTCSPQKKQDVTAKIDCQILCLLDISDPTIQINDIRPVVCYVSKFNQMEGCDVSYQQAPINWDTYTVVTAKENRRTFYCSDFSQIILNETNAVSEKEELSIGKKHYSPYVYCVDFHINITIQLPHDDLPYQHCVIVRSAPFGLVTNKAQSADLFAKVFLEDLKDWKSISVISNTTTCSSTMINLTLADIVESIRQYFIYKTGVYPNYWVIPYIEQQLGLVTSEGQNLMNNTFYNVLAKILAQIDYMSEHPLLSFMHDDGLFFGICCSEKLDHILLRKIQRGENAVCVLRFGGLENMSDAKDIGIRVVLANRSHPDVQRYSFDVTKLSMELGLFIIKISLSEVSCFEKLLFNNIKSSERSHEIILEDMQIFVDLYYSEKLKELCPHETRYSSIWIGLHNNKENNKSIRSNSSSTSIPAQHCSMTTTTAITTNNIPFDQYHTNMCVNNQLQQQLMQQPQSQYSAQSYRSNFSNVSSYGSVYSYTPENNQAVVTSNPIVIVVTSPDQHTILPENILQFISNQLPEFAPLMQYRPVSYLTLNLPAQGINPPIEPIQNSFPNVQSTSLFSEQDINDQFSITDPTNMT